LTICSLSESDGPSESHLASKEKPQPTPDTQHRKKFDSISYGSGISWGNVPVDVELEGAALLALSR
jgi:hypothetical protein